MWSLGAGLLRLHPGERPLAEIHDRPYLDAPQLRQRTVGRDLDRLVEVPRIDEDEATQLLLGLGEGTIRHRYATVPDADGHRGMGGLERVRDDAVTAPTQLGVVGNVLP